MKPNCQFLPYMGHSGKQKTLNRQLLKPHLNPTPKAHYISPPASTIQYLFIECTKYNVNFSSVLCTLLPLST